MSNLQEESKLMRLCRAARLDSIAWTLRRLHCPVPANALVLEVGAGGNPYPRSNVLLDAYEDTQQRHWEPLRRDRPLVLGFIENLPFKDGAFDFLIAAHVLEHSTQPEKALAEFQRVAKAGYIEVPDAIFERCIPYLDHRLEITVREGSLQIRKKAAWSVDPELVELCHRDGDGPIGGRLVSRNPFDFHVRYYWEGSIRYIVLNPEVDNTWRAPVVQPPTQTPRSWGLRSLYLELTNSLISQAKRNARLDLIGLLRCPSCGSTDLKVRDAILMCPSCQTSYPYVSGVPHLLCPDGPRPGT